MFHLCIDYQHPAWMIGLASRLCLSMPSLSTSAIVLATFRYGESSKIVRLATETAGVQSAIAKGALRPRSRFGAALQVLSDGQAHLIVHANRELQLLTAFDLQRVRVDLTSGMERYAAASALAEVMLRFAPAEGHAESFQVLRSGLDALESVPAEAVEEVGLRALWCLVGSLGFEPTLEGCVRCGAELGASELLFEPRDGGALCRRCGGQNTVVKLGEADRADLESLVRPDAPLPSLSRRQAAAHRRLLARYIQYHLGEGVPLPALDFWIRRPWGAA
jgi:DNA repair protein RecO (recombination protein O)